jgi:diguanylate cyclase (GGDEF)-like protein
LTTLLGSAAAALPEGPIAIGTADGTTWIATGPSGSGTPLPANLLLGLAALAVLALPLGWLANRPPRTRTTPAAPPADPAPARGSTATGVVAAPVQAQRLPAYQRPPTPTPAPAVAMAAAAAVPAEAAPVPVAGPEATPPPARKGRFGLGRRRAEAEPSVAAPLLVEPPVALATPSDELLDTLTGLGNQRAFGEEMDRLMVGWERNRVPFAVLLLDVDDLKITNARAGHTAGDEILRTLGRHVKAMLRFSDRAFRVGGDEIAVLLPHTDAPGAAQLGQRLLAKVRAGTGGEPAVAFSAGAAALPGPSQDRDQLMGHANAALAWGKTHGRASVLAYDPATHAGQTDAERVAQATAVAQVIAERTLRAVFQPIVDMQTGDVVGFEGLTRPTPGAPFTNPGQLFEAAELVGRTVELDAACFETIVQGARAIPSDRVVTINLSPRTMEAADFSVANVLEVLRSHDLDPGRVVLELTERESVLDLDRLRDNLSELQRAGVRIAADDVGAGNAGLRLLSQFRFDIVKVDLGLVQEGANNEASQAVLRSLRDLAQRWGAFVIAEGIETSTQLKVVRELGLSAGQGYLIGRPGTIVDLPPVDLDGLCEGGLMLQNAPVPSALPHGSPA